MDRLATPLFLGFPGGSDDNLPAMQDTWVPSLDWEDPWRRAWQPTPVFLPEEFPGQRRLLGYNPQDHEESDTIRTISTAICVT